MDKVFIKNIAYYVPENDISNEDIIKANDLKIKNSWIENRIGITNRRWASHEMAASDLAVNAVKKLNLKNFQGAIWTSTISSDYLTPSTSSIIKGKLGFSDSYPAIDLNAACAGQIFALEMAYNRLMMSDEQEALVIATEMRSCYLNKKDRRTVFLFADGACAFHLKKTDKDSPSFIEWIHSQTICSEEFEILVPAGGSVCPPREGIDFSEFFIKMQNGDKIFTATTEHLVTLINDELEKRDQKISDFDFFVFHQGNGAIIKKVCDSLGVSHDKTYINFNKFGNTSSASMGIALSEAYEKGLIKKMIVF